MTAEFTEQEFDQQVDDILKAQAARQARRKAKGFIDEANGMSFYGFEDFYAYGEQHKYIYLPTGRLWPQPMINAILPKRDRLKASTWLDQHQSVQQMTWFPGEPTLIKDKHFLDGEFINKTGATIFNHYRPPSIQLGDAAQASPWRELVLYVYPEQGEWIIDWCAYRYQHPDIKINHALVLGGTQGIGKDTILAPLHAALGYWNCKTVSPDQLSGTFTGFRKTVLLVVSEARDLGDMSREQFYNRCKDLIAAPPNAMMVNEKNTHEYQIPNLCGVVFTTNYKTGGLYLPANDRRHLVCWSEREPTEFEADYWRRMYGFYEGGGYGHIAAYLTERDVSGFDPKAPAERTKAFYEMSSASRAPESTDMEDALDKLGSPNAVTVQMILDAPSVDEDFKDWLKDTRNRTRIPRRFEDCDMIAIRNPDAKNGVWRIKGQKTMAYARKTLSTDAAVEAVRRLGVSGLAG